VGRPIAVTDLCALVPRAWEPTAPYLWLGTGIAPGIHEYDNGFVQETIDVGGVSVTAGAVDADLREEILSSARTGHLCDAVRPEIPGARATVAGDRRGGLILAHVCAYRRDGEGAYRLSYAAEVDPVDAETAFAAAESAPTAPPIDCDGVRTEFMILHATYHDEFPNDVVERTAVFDPFCGGSVDLGRGPQRAMTPEAVEPWAGNGIPSVVYGPSGGLGAMIDSFIGQQG
jgi:hypothetical protein